MTSYPNFTIMAAMANFAIMIVWLWPNNHLMVMMVIAIRIGIVLDLSVIALLNRLDKSKMTA